MKNRVKITRVMLNMTQGELARQVGVTRQTIGLVEKGEYNPTLQLCVAIAEALNKTLDDLFWEVGKE
ncbi:transcriptional regulator [Gracilibacillus orientalis]|uniref:Transcriptional regulator n=1 Tax=Gracilibacillus orientalis TaxID=334253 RepID=A0A1I4IKC0_9BACI|nr:helix-turn-helix transcriptional regulator [Gracilibacillus orientalis]SFL54849.1 transcriptional regulator [Gracilibacillus orientalis]